MIEYNHLFLTEKCNLQCDYCDIPQIKKPKSCTIEDLEKYLPIFNNDNKFLDILGGEVGVLPDDVLEYLFKNIKKPLQISTNGLFLKNKYEKFKHLLGEHWFYYHVAEEPFEFEPLQYDNVKYTFVVHDNNIEALNEIYKKYNETEELDFRPCFGKFKNQSKIFNVDAHKDQIEFPIEYHSFNDKLFEIRNKLCFMHGPPFMYDLVNGRIIRCCKSYTLSDTIELTQTTFDTINKQKDNFEVCSFPWNDDLYNSLCKTCSKQYSKNVQNKNDNQLVAKYIHEYKEW